MFESGMILLFSLHDTLHEEQMYAVFYSRHAGFFLSELNVL